MAVFKGRVFGPGFADAGTPVSFEADADGIRLEAASDHAPRWSAITVGKAGWDGTRLGLEWDGTAGRYALTIADAAAVQALGALAGRRAVRSAGAGSGTHAWVWGIVGATLLLPLLLLLALLLAHEPIADWIVERIPVAQEQKLGAQLFNSHKAGLKLIDGAPLAMVRETGARLTQGSAYKYEFYVVDDKSVNAYAMPGGYIVIHSGLMALAGSADEVAGVLAHEVAHAERRHSLRGMIKSAGLYATASLLFGDFGSLAGVGADLLNLKFSRDNERDADSTGLTLLVKAGLEPSAMASFFRKMAAQGGGVPAFLSTHPASEDRFAEIERAVKALPEAARTAPSLAYDYAAIKAALPGMPPDIK